VRQLRHDGIVFSLSAESVSITFADVHRHRKVDFPIITVQLKLKSIIPISEIYDYFY